MRNYGHLPAVCLEGWVAGGEELVEPVELGLQRGPDLHAEQRAGVVHDVHPRGVQQRPAQNC